MLAMQAKFRAHAVRRRLNRWESMASTVQSAFRGPSSALFASRSVRRALLASQVNAGSPLSLR